MIGEKRGLSTIVVTLIIILLSLVAVGIVWVVVRNIIVGGTASTQVGSQCLNVDVQASNINCSNGASDKVCSFTLTRTGTGNDVLGGVKLVFRNSTSAVYSSAQTILGDIPQLQPIRKTMDANLSIAQGVNSVDITPFFLDSSGSQQICPNTETATGFS